MEKVIEIRENACGGSGKMIIEHLLNKEQLNGMCRIYARVTMPEGSSLGFHEHFNESETYFIISGNGIFTDNEHNEIHVKEGDTTFTGNGEGHGIANAGKEPLVFMALIINDEKRVQK